MEEVHDRARTRGIRRRAALILAGGAISVSALAAGAAAASTPGIKITTVKTSDGKVLEIGSATVYTLKPSSNQCAAACFAVWPPVMLPAGAKHATAGTGVTASKLGTVKVPGGTQVTYGGKRLYKFTGDTGSGQVNGNITDTWGKWAAIVISKSGAAAHGAGSTTTTAGAGSSGAGSGGVSF